MAQISLYMDNSMINRLSAAAQTNNCSISKYVASLVAEKLANYDNEEMQKKQVLERLCGALDDETFALPPELAYENEIIRKYNLI